MAFEFAPSLYEHIRRNAKLLGNGEEVGLMRFQAADRRSEERGLGDSAAKFVCPDSGQVDEPLGASSIPKRCGERGKRDSLWIGWRILGQSLTLSRKLVGGANWPRS